MTEERLVREKIADRLACFVGYKQGLLSMSKSRRQAYLDEANQILSIPELAGWRRVIMSGSHIQSSANKEV